MSAPVIDKKTKRILTPLVRTGPMFYLTFVVLLGVLVFANYAWSTQLRDGLSVTGMNDKVSWGLYIAAFVYFIGISYGGTCVSAILRLTNTEWRRPITRVAEASTVAALLVAVMMPLFDIGRPERLLYLVRYGRIESPLVWDFLSIGTYLVASLIFFYLATIPDLALLDRLLPARVRFRRILYRVFKMRWEGTPEQVRRLERALLVISIIIIPIAVSAHTVLSWMFGMTTRVGWHSTIFGPYFVGGALFSGIAVVVVAMAVLRKAHRLEKVITVDHFRQMANILLVFGLAYLYFTLSEYLTISFQPTPEDAELLHMLTTGPVAPYFWFSTVGLVFVVAMLALPWTRTVFGITLAAVLINVALWIKRMIIVIPSLQVPLIEGDALGVYNPTWVEWSIIAGSFAAFLLVFVVLSKLVPFVSLWEIYEGDKMHAASSAAPSPPTAPHPTPTAADATGVALATTEVKL